MGYFRVPVEVLSTMDHTKLFDLVVIARPRHRLTREGVEPPQPDKKPPTNATEKSTKLEEASTKKLLEDYDDEKDVTLEENFFPNKPPTQNAKWDLGFDRQRFDAYKPVSVYEFLLVEWIDVIAYRIGIGKAHIDA